MDQEKNKAATAGAIALIVGLVAGFLIGWYWYKGICQRAAGTETTGGLFDDLSNGENATSTDNNGTITSSTTKPSVSVTGTGTLKVNDQKAGSVVTVSHVDAPGTTWVTVRDLVNGKVGNILGAQRISGTSNNISVSLLRPTKAGSSYRIYLYKDNGDMTFNSKTDSFIIGMTADFKAN
jgi:hypothetical protein